MQIFGVLIWAVLKWFLSLIGTYFSIAQLLDAIGIDVLISFLKHGTIWVIFFGIALFITWFHSFRNIKGTLRDKDVNVIIEFCSVLNKKWNTVVPINTNFDSSFLKKQGVSSRSVQAEVFRKVYNSSVAEIDSKIAAFLEVHENKKIEGKYPIGTVVKDVVDPYCLLFLAVADMNKNSASSMKPQMIITALDGLWVYLDENDSNDKPLALPLIGCGQGRLVEKHTDVVHMIIESFVSHVDNANSSSVKDLIICIPYSQIIHHSIDIKKLSLYIDYICNKPKLSSNFDSKKILTGPN